MKQPEKGGKTRTNHLVLEASREGGAGVGGKSGVWTGSQRTEECLRKEGALISLCAAERWCR